jgi:hypothetical protein
MEKLSVSLRGTFCDILKDKNGNIIYDSGWQSNKILDGARILLAGLMKNLDTSGGIQSVNVGQGDILWDNEPNGPPEPEASDTDLLDPDPYSIQVENLTIQFLDENDNHVTLPTSRLKITVTFGQDQPPAPTGSTVSSYPLREFGLFGSYDDGTGALEFMINSVRHKVIHKDTSTTLVRTIKLYF